MVFAAFLDFEKRVLGAKGRFPSKDYNGRRIRLHRAGRAVHLGKGGRPYCV